EGLTEALAAEAELDVEGEAGGVVGAGGAAEALDADVTGLAVGRLHAEGGEAVVVAAVAVVTELVRGALAVAGAAHLAAPVEADAVLAVGVLGARGDAGHAGAVLADEALTALESALAGVV